LVGKMSTADRRGSADGRSGHPPSENLVDFSASVVVLQDDGYSVVLAFGDHPVEPEHSVVLSFTQQPTKQDVKLGLAGLYVELGEQIRGDYDVVDDIYEIPVGIALKFAPAFAERCGVAVNLAIAVSSADLERVRPVIPLLREKARGAHT
jgi:hypothetical protein